jgi:hypothetical protein
MESLLTGLVLYFAFPLWLLAGFIDYLCHRATDIEHTSGVRESRLHVVQYVQILAAAAFTVLFKINLLVVAIVIAIVAAHTFTGARDVFQTAQRRYISPLEQLVHSYLEVLPIVGAALLVVAWSAGAGAAHAKGVTIALQLKSREEQLSPKVLAWVAVGMFFAGLAVFEEFRRTRLAARSM